MLAALAQAKDESSPSTSPLHEAAKAGDIESLRKLLETGADVNAKGACYTLISGQKAGDNIGTALHSAAYHGKTKAAAVLIRHGGNVNARGGDGSTPLHHAATIGSEALARVLLKNGADVNAKDNWDRTPATYAMDYDHYDVVEFLAENGSNLTVWLAAYIGDLQKTKEFIDSGIDVNMHNDLHDTLLQVAAMNGHVDVVKLLFDHQIDIPTGHDSLLHNAIFGGTEVLELLLSKGININAIGSLWSYDLYDVTPLHAAVFFGYREEAELLIRRGADVNAQDGTVGGETPLQLAIRVEKLDMASLLISHGADANIRDYWDDTLLHTASLEGKTRVIKLLLAQGADVKAKNKYGHTPLHMALVPGIPSYTPEDKREAVEVLLRHGAEINAGDKWNTTPLHQAARDGNLGMAELLLKNGADPNASDINGKTPLDYAVSKGSMLIVELLDEHTGQDQTQNHLDDSPQSFGIMDRAREEATQLKDMPLLVKDNTAFMFKLYEQLQAENNNIFFSPYSISTALAMTYAGARGTTEQQIKEALEFSLPQDKLHPAFFRLQASLAQQANHVNLCLANSLWPQQGAPFIPDYLALVKKHYNISITPVDYQTDYEKARKQINQWVENKTDQKIKDLIAPGLLDRLTHLVLVNAIYFKGTWANPFEAYYTREASFYISHNQSVLIPMMGQEQSVRYKDFPSLQVLEFPYVDGNLSMLILLPKRLLGVRQLEQFLSAQNLAVWRHSLEKTEVRIFLPKFKITSCCNLKKNLQAIGMIDAFSDSNANFAGMDGRPDWLYIKEVVHKAFIQVNERGSEAAAATAAVGSRAGRRPMQLPVFRVDHPFIFLIQDSQTGTVLFLGRVMDPTRKS